MAITWKNFYKFPCKTCGQRGFHKFSCSRAGREPNTFFLRDEAYVCPGCGRTTKIFPCHVCLRANGEL